MSSREAEPTLTSGREQGRTLPQAGGVQADVPTRKQGGGVQIDVPAPNEAGGTTVWGSDVIAEALRSLDLPYIALNPGASYRGLHDSIVNHLGNREPSMLVCLHEEHAVAIAHGYAKVTGLPMAVAIHSNVGLMHASMAIFNAFCDRVPMVVIGADGPIDAAVRRPWIDWIHTSADIGALIRSYVKWDDRPASVPAAVQSLVQANHFTRTYPPAPTFVCLDTAIQEQVVEDPPGIPEPRRTAPPAPPWPSAAQVEQAKALLAASERTVMLVGRVGGDERAWSSRIELAEALGAQVLTELKLAAGFPTRHPRHAAIPGGLLTPSGIALLRDASLILSLDWVDLSGTFAQAFDDGRTDVPVIHCSMDHVLHGGWSKASFALPEADLAVAAYPDAFVEALLAAGVTTAGDYALTRAVPESEPPSEAAISVRGLARELSRAVAETPVSLLRVPLAWDGADVDFRESLDFIGYDGGAGIGSGPGVAVGAALALAGSGRLPVAVLGDGDLLMGATALWTAARHRIPLLVIVSNNRSFYNDEMHQERVARQRGRPVENRWIGQHIRDPEPDLAGLARSLGLIGYGPVGDASELAEVLASAIRQVRDEGACVLVDVLVGAANYQIDARRNGGSAKQPSEGK